MIDLYKLLSLGNKKIMELETLLGKNPNDRYGVVEEFFSEFKYTQFKLQELTEHIDGIVKMNNEQIMNKMNMVVKKLENENKALENKLISIQNKSKGNITKKNYITVHKIEDSQYIVKEYRFLNNKSEIGAHYISKSVVDQLLKIIKKLCGRDSKKIYYINIASEIIHDNYLNIRIDEFNGGKNRAKYLMPLYYYPIKILQFYKYIKYDKHGGVILLKNGELNE